MSKENTWVDYANLASNVAQNVQLQGLAKKLETGLYLANSQVENEAEQKRRRDWLWNLKALQASILESDGEPTQQAYLLLKLVKQADSKDASLFDAWEDKERFAEIKKSSRQALQRIEASIGAERMSAVSKGSSLADEELPALRDYINLR